MDPHRAQGQSKTRIEAGGQTCPAHDPAAVRPLEPGQRPLGLVARDSLLDRASARLWGCPHARRHRGAPPTSAEAMAQVFGVIALIRGQHRAPLARSALLTHADVQGLQPRDNLGPLVAIGGRRTRGHRHASGVREAVDEDALALPARRDALTAACARGNRRHPPRHTATASCRVPRPAPGGARAWRPGSHRPASAAATDARHPWTPMGARAGGRTSGSRRSGRSAPYAPPCERGYGACPDAASSAPAEKDRPRASTPSHFTLRRCRPSCPPRTCRAREHGKPVSGIGSWESPLSLASRGSGRAYSRYFRAVPEQMYGLQFGFPWWTGASQPHVPDMRVQTAVVRVCGATWFVEPRRPQRRWPCAPSTRGRAGVPVSAASLFHAA
jgi:hypothetical protein